MSRVVFSSLKTAVKGTAFLAAGSAVSLGLWFGIKVLIVRSLSQADFGIYSLALTIMAMASALANLGLGEGVARQISVFRGRGDDKAASGAVKSAIQIAMVSGLAAALVLVVGSRWLANSVFNMPGLSGPVKIIAIGVLGGISLEMLIAVFRGYGNMKAKCARDVAQPFIYSLLLVALILFKAPFFAVIAAFVIAILLSLAGVTAYAFKALDVVRTLSREIKTSRRELMWFSIPLLGVSLTTMVMAWTDTLMIGYFMRAEDVGVYSAGVSLSRLLVSAITLLSFVFMPIAGELYAKGKKEELKRTYQVLTKWLLMSTFPLFLVLFFFPEMTLLFVFGKQYEAAAMVLKILSLRYMLALLVGSSSMLLTVLGRPRLLLAIAAVGSALNIILNYSLIPAYGLVGAAVATLLAALLFYALCSAALYRLSGIHPFTARYLRPVAWATVIALAIYVVAKSIPLYFWMLPLYFILFIGGYLFSILITRSIEKEDIDMFEAVTERLGLELKPVKNIIRRFAHE